MSLQVDVSAARIPEIDKDATLLRVHLIAPPLPETDHRPAQFALLVDRSSSMSGAPLAAAAAAATGMVERLNERDRLTLVAFDGYAAVLADASPMDKEHKEAVIARLRSLVPGVGTNLSAAVNAGLAALSRVLLRGASPRMLLLTDGEPSVGIRSAYELVALASQVHHAGISLSCAGVGSRYDAELLSKMAEAGGGAFHHLPTADHIAGVLMREVDGVSQAAASDVALYIAPSDQVSTVELLHRLPTQHKEGSLRIQVGEVCAGAHRTALLLVRGTGDALGTLRVTFDTADGGAQLVAPRSLTVGDGGEPGRRAVASEWLQLKVADALDRAWHLAVTQRSTQAVTVLEDLLTLAGRLKGAGLQTDVVLEAIDRIEATRSLMARADAERAELEAARRADKAFSHGTMVSRVFKKRDD
jgi:Ca-activated chloride channel family protein